MYRFIITDQLRPLAIVLTVMAVILVFGSMRIRAKEDNQRPVITNPGFSASAERVELFQGIDNGKLATKFVPKDSSGGFILVTNRTSEPLTVELPNAFVAVQVLKQVGGGLGGGGGQQNGQQGGQNQNAGGGFGGGGGGLGGGGLGGGGLGGGQQGGGFFSIPPERTVRVPYVSVCLNHGKPDPSARLKYRLMPVEDYAKDEVLAELIHMVGSGKLNQHSAQAAVWNRTDNMGWQELAHKNTRGILGVEYYFSPQNIYEGQMIMAAAIDRVRERSAAVESMPEQTALSRVP
jgi:hypothetical protein